VLFRCFVGLSANEPVWHHTVFRRNRDRLLDSAVAEELFSLVVQQARAERLLSMSVSKGRKYPFGHKKTS
jgi:transposase